VESLFDYEHWAFELGLLHGVSGVIAIHYLFISQEIGFRVCVEELVHINLPF